MGNISENGRKVYIYIYIYKIEVAFQRNSLIIDVGGFFAAGGYWSWGFIAQLIIIFLPDQSYPYLMSYYNHLEPTSL